jgi:transposase
MLACRMFDERMEPAQIARVVQADPQTVRSWRREYEAANKNHAALLLAQGHAGPKRRLSDAQRAELLVLLKEHPQTYGFDAWLWTTSLIARLILTKFGVEYHHDHVGAILRELEWSYQQPMRRARERDEQAITQWRESTWPELEKKVESRAK